MARLDEAQLGIWDDNEQPRSCINGKSKINSWEPKNTTSMRIRKKYNSKTTNKRKIQGPYNK